VSAGQSSLRSGALELAGTRGVRLLVRQPGRRHPTASEVERTACQDFSGTAVRRIGHDAIHPLHDDHVLSIQRHHLGTWTRGSVGVGESESADRNRNDRRAADRQLVDHVDSWIVDAPVDDCRAETGEAWVGGEQVPRGVGRDEPADQGREAHTAHILFLVGTRGHLGHGGRTAASDHKIQEIHAAGGILGDDFCTAEERTPGHGGHRATGESRIPGDQRWTPNDEHLSDRTGDPADRPERGVGRHGNGRLVGDGVDPHDLGGRGRELVKGENVSLPVDRNLLGIGERSRSQD